MNQLIVTTPEYLQKLIEDTIAKYQPATPTLAPKAETYLYSIEELANFLGCSIVTAHKLKKSGRIRFKQFGRKLIFATSEVLEDIANTKKR